MYSLVALCQYSSIQSYVLKIVKTTSNVTTTHVLWHTYILYGMWREHETEEHGPLCIECEEHEPLCGKYGP